MTELRDYQKAMIDGVREAWRAGHKHPCLVAPCGAGKSLVAAEMTRQATMRGKRVLFFVHRKELCEQIEQTFRTQGADMRLCQIGMVQTLTRRAKSLEPPDLIITDENHHCLAKSYRNIYEAFPEVYTVGLTATPTRLSGGGLGDVNDALVESVTARWLIDHGYLAPYDYYAPSVADLTGLHTRRGDYVAKEIEDRLIQKAVFGDVIENYTKLAEGKQAICYCASVEHSKRMAAEFREAGIAALHIDGETPTAERDRAIASFRNGETKLLCNVDLISEGFDVPDCSAAILLRPTKSLTLFIQQSMRPMRYKQGKRAVIIDHVGNYARHGLPDDERKWSLDPKRPKEMQPLSAQLRECPECHIIHVKSLFECPRCGHIYPPPARDIKELRAAHLERISGIVLDYKRPDDCRSYDELRAYAAQKGYKPGWCYFQAKRLGIMR